MPITIYFADEDDDDDDAVNLTTSTTFETQAGPFGSEWISSVNTSIIFVEESPTLCDVELPFSDNNNNNNHSYAYLAESGECKWKEKAQNVIALGGDYLILYNNKPDGFAKDDEGDTNVIPENDDIRIGVILISQDAGQTIQNQIENAANAANGNTTVPVQLRATIEETYINAFADPQNAKPAAIIMKITGALSLLGSAYITVSLLLKRRRTRRTLQQGQTNSATTSTKRNPTLFLLLLSMADMISSLALFLGTWPIPKSPGNFGQLSDAIWQTYFPWATGTRGTCAAQGFLFQLGSIAAGLCTACIAIQSLCLVKYRWTQAQLQRLERWLLLVVMTIAFTTAIAAAVLGLYNPLTFGFCWINKWPAFCDEYDNNSGTIMGKWCQEVQQQDSSNNRNHGIYRLLFAIVWMTMTAVIIMACMVQLFCWVRRQERKAARYSDNAREGRAQKQVLWKAMWYVGSCLVLYTISSIAMFVNSPGFNILLSLTLPLQGFVNALIYSNKLDSIARRLQCDGGLYTYCCCFCCCGADSQRANTSVIPQLNWTYLVGRSTKESETRDPIRPDG